MMKAQRVAAWEEVAKRMAHEIKNPLTPIKLSAERLKKKFGGKAGEGGEDLIFNEMVDTIIKEVGDLKNLVDEFSLYARLPEANFEYINVNYLINDVLSLYKNAHKDIEFITNLDEDLPEVFIDKQQMKRAFMNIIDNGAYSVLLKRQGRKESGYNGKITATTKKDAAQNIVRIVFADNGTGMESEVMQNMYEPYFSTKQGGTGLGLAITKNIMVENNAQIRAENNEDGGVSFIIELNFPPSP
jgi:two-component system nitrogen regulation sensor histidine kinase NtrY